MSEKERPRKTKSADEKSKSRAVKEKKSSKTKGSGNEQTKPSTNSKEGSVAKTQTKTRKKPAETSEDKKQQSVKKKTSSQKPKEELDKKKEGKQQKETETSISSTPTKTPKKTSSTDSKVKKSSEKAPPKEPKSRKKPAETSEDKKPQSVKKKASSQKPKEELDKKKQSKQQKETEASVSSSPTKTPKKTSSTASKTKKSSETVPPKEPKARSAKTTGTKPETEGTVRKQPTPKRSKIQAKSKPRPQSTSTETPEASTASQISREASHESPSLSDRTVSVSTEIIEDKPTTPVGKIMKSRLKFGTPLDMKKHLLPNEEHLTSKMVIYFDEGQIFVGFFVFLLAFVSYYFFTILGLSIVLGLLGCLLMVTGYASEELHITDTRIFLRRMNWVDRIFRIPKDSQYILDEIVSFDIQRAPANQVLLVSSLIPFLGLFFDLIRSSTILVVIIITVGLIIFGFSQRLGKRTLSFSMSGGHLIHLGQYKGIPTSVVDTFIDIVMEKNIFESDAF